MKYMKTVLKIWGGLCIFIAVVYLWMALYSSAIPYIDHSDLGFASVAEWVGRALISLGLARTIELLEKK